MDTFYQFFYKKPKLNSFQYLFLFILMVLGSAQLKAQTDIEQIAIARNASNAALKSYDIELLYTFLTDDVLITTGNGTLLNGKEELKAYIMSFGVNKMYWIRTSNEIEINNERGLAWESGTWKGYDPEKSSKAIASGKYSAMWTKESGVWLIKSQLFVTID